MGSATALREEMGLLEHLYNPHSPIDALSLQKTHTLTVSRFCSYCNKAQEGQYK